MSARRSRGWKLLCIYLAHAMLLAVFIFPLIWVFGISLKTRPQVFTSPPLFLWTPTLENYANVLRTAGFLQGLLNSVLIAGGAVALSFCAGVPGLCGGAVCISGPRHAVHALLVMCACCRRSRCCCRCTSCL